MLTMYHGEQKTWAGAATDNGSALDLTGATLYFVARLGYPETGEDDADAVISLSSATSASITKTNAAGGLYTLTINPADIAALRAPCTLKYTVAVMLYGETERHVIDAGELEILAQASAS